MVFIPFVDFLLRHFKLFFLLIYPFRLSHWHFPPTAVNCWPWEVECSACTPLVLLLHSRRFKPLKQQYVHGFLYSVLLSCTYICLTWPSITSLFPQEWLSCISCSVTIHPLVCFYNQPPYNMWSLHSVSSSFSPRCISFSCVMFRGPPALSF